VACCCSAVDADALECDLVAGALRDSNIIIPNAAGMMDYLVLLYSKGAVILQRCSCASLLTLCTGTTNTALLHVEQLLVDCMLLMMLMSSFSRIEWMNR
jgi:hypothetical protein